MLNRVRTSILKMPDRRKKYVRELLIIGVIVVTAFLSQMHYFRDYVIVPGNWADGDSSNQMLPMYMVLGQHWQDGNYFWSWNLGLGGDLFSELSYYYTTSPIFIFSYLIASAFGIDFGNPWSVILLKTVMSVGRQAFASYFMYRLAVYEKPGRTLTGLAGGIIYTLQPFFFRLASYFDFMTDIYVYLPLVVLTYQRWRREGKKPAFVLSLAVLIASNFYFAFMGCLFLASLFIFNAFGNHSMRNGIKEIHSVARPLLSLMISAVAFIPAVQTLFESSRQPTAFSLKDMLPTISFVKTQLNDLILAPRLFAIPVILLLILFIRSDDNAYRIKRRLLGFWIIFYFLPFTGHLMNGFGYRSTRWIFILIFLFAYIFPDFVEALSAWKPKYPIAFLAVAGLLVWRHNRGFNALRASHRYHVVLFILFVIFTLISLVATYALAFFKKATASKRSIPILVTSVIASSLLLSMMHNTFLFGGSRDRELDHQAVYGSDWKYDNLYKPDNENFFRVANETIRDYFHYNVPLLGFQYGLSAYQSMADGKLVDYVRKDLNVRQEKNITSVYKGFDSRIFLETAWGVKFKISPHTRLPAGYSDQEVADINAFVLNDPVGIDLWYDSFIPESEWNTLPVAEKDGLLLQTASVPDRFFSKIPDQTWDQMSPADVAEEIVIDWDTVTMENMHLDPVEGVLTVYGDGKLQKPSESDVGILIIPLKPRFAGEYILHFDLIPEEDTLELTSPNGFQLSVNRNRTLNMRSDYMYHYDMNTFTFRIPHTSPHLKIELTPGTYRIENLRLTYSSYRHLETWVEERNQFNLEHLNVEKNRISGVISNDEDGLLALSVPYTKGWHARVDGSPHDLIQTNGMLTGLYLEKGEHTLFLYYLPPGLLPGVILSVLGILILVFSSALKRAGKSGRAVKADKRTDNSSE